MGFVVAFAVALGAALVCTPLARRASFALGILDRPGPLKTHREPVAYLGGAAVFVALAVVLAVKDPRWLLPLALATALGVADDVHAISPPLRLLFQASIGGVAGIVEPAPGPVGVLVTAVLVVVLVNAVNLIDGMDGLASTVVAISAAGFALLGADVAPPALALCGALLGFLVFNRPPARIYLGDGGSYLLGATLALLASAGLADHRVSPWLALPLFVAVPLADTAIAIVRRQRSGRSWLAGDRSHVYDQLADRGWSITRVLMLCGAVQLVAIGAALLSWHLAAAGAGAVLAVCAAAAAVGVWRSGFIAQGAPT